MDYRGYAKAVIDRLAPALYGETLHAAAETVAIYISRDREIAEAVVSMMRRRFEKGADPDGLDRAVTRLEFYDAGPANSGELVQSGQPN